MVRRRNGEKEGGGRELLTSFHENQRTNRLERKIAAIFKLHYPIGELWLGKPFHRILFGTAAWVSLVFGGVFFSGNIYFSRAVVVKEAKDLIH